MASTYAGLSMVVPTYSERFEALPNALFDACAAAEAGLELAISSPAVRRGVHERS